MYWRSAYLQLTKKLIALSVFCLLIVSRVSIPAQNSQILPFPLIINERYISDIDVKVVEGDFYLVSEQFLYAVEGEMVPELIGTIRKIGNTWLPLTELRQAGVNITMNPSTLQLELILGLTDIPVKELILYPQEYTRDGSYLQPVDFNMILNLSANATIANWDDILIAGSSPISFHVKPQLVLQLAGWVLDTSHTVSSAGDETYSLDSVALSRDWADKSIRMTVGNLHYRVHTYQNAYLSKGIVVSYLPREIHSQDYSRKASLFEDKISIAGISDVTVRLNDSVIFNDILYTGNYLFSGFRFPQGINTITYSVQDMEGGETEEQILVAYDNLLLDKGESEFNIGVGVPEWELSIPGLFANQRYGILDNLTLEYMVQLMLEQQNAGVGCVCATPHGTYALSGAVSNIPGDEFGFAAHFEYEYHFILSANNIRYGLSADYITAAYTPFGSVPNESGNDLMLSGYLGSALMEGVNLSNRIKAVIPTAPEMFSIQDTITCNMHITPQFDVQLDGSIDFGEDGIGWEAKISCKYQPGTTVSLNANSDVSTGNTNAYIQYIPILERDKGLVSLNIENFSVDTLLPASISINGNLNSSLYSSYLQHGMKISQSGTQQNTSVTVSSALVYADGLWGICSYVSDGFILADMRAVRGFRDNSGDVLGMYDDAGNTVFGTVVKSSIHSYQANSVLLNDYGIPPQYMNSMNNYLFFPGYRQAAIIRPESTPLAYAHGVLLYADGNPVQFMLGSALPLSDPENEVLTFFTDGRGNFYIYNLYPGRYRLSLDRLEDFSVDIIIPKESAVEVFLEDIVLPIHIDQLTNLQVPANILVSESAGGK